MWKYQVTSVIGALTAMMVLTAATTASAIVVNTNEDFNAGLPADATTFGNTVAIVAPLTTDDFDSAGTSKTFGGDGTQAVISGGPTANFLRLVRGSTQSDDNRVGYDRTTTGNGTKMVADFDFRMTPGNGRADGMGMGLVNTANYGTSGDPGYFAETPNLTGSVGVGFDIYSNSESSNNHISFHYNNAQVGSNFDLNPTTQIDLANGQFHHAELELTWVASATAEARLTLTPDVHGTPGTPVILTQTITGIAPYEARLAFGARTGGQTADHEYDNIVADYGPIDQGAIQLVPAVGNQSGGLAFDDVTDGRTAAEWTADFDFRSRIGGDNRGADGFSLTFVRGDDVGTAGETGRSSGLAVGFDTYDNGVGAGDPDGNHVQVFFDGSPVAGSVVSLAPFGINAEDGYTHNASISVSKGLLDLMIDGQSILDDLAIPGWAAYNGRFNFGARTGGAVADFYIDNFSTTLNAVPEPSTLAMLLGLAGLGMVGYLRRRAR